MAGSFKKIGCSDLPQQHCGCRLDFLGSTVANDTPKSSF